MRGAFIFLWLYAWLIITRAPLNIQLITRLTKIFKTPVHIKKISVNNTYNFITLHHKSSTINHEKKLFS